MQKYGQWQPASPLSRDYLAAILSAALVGVMAAGLDGNEPEGPQFRFDPDKALVLKPGPKRPPFSTHECLSSDGKLRAEAEYKKISVFSVPGNQLLHEFATENLPMAPTFSPDLRTIAFADARGNLATESVIHTLDLETGEQTKIGSCYGAMLRLTFSGDGKRLAGATVYGPVMAMVAKQRWQREFHGEVAVFDVSSGRDLLHRAHVLPEGISITDGEKSFPFLPIHIGLDEAGSTLLLATTSGLIKVIDVKTGDRSISMEVNPSAFDRSRETEPSNDE